jgi:hypothetical protein
VQEIVHGIVRQFVRRIARLELYFFRFFIKRPPALAPPSFRVALPDGAGHAGSLPRRHASAQNSVALPPQPSAPPPPPPQNDGLPTYDEAMQQKEGDNET